MRVALRVALMAAVATGALAEKGDLYGADGKEKGSLVEQVCDSCMPSDLTASKALASLRCSRTHHATLTDGEESTARAQMTVISEE